MVTQAMVLEAYDPLKMFKAPVIRAWHSLNDEALEEILRVRLDFTMIIRLEYMPDAATIYRFHNLLIKQALMGELLAEVNQQA